MEDTLEIIQADIDAAIASEPGKSLTHCCPVYQAMARRAGPDMTVTTVVGGYAPEYVGCVWFEKQPGSDEWGACNTQQFHIDSLTTVKSAV